MKKQFHELIHEVKQKISTSETLANKRNFLNESYLEYEFLNMKDAVHRLIANVEHISKQENFEGKFFMNILENPKKFASSLLSVCLNLIEVIEEQPRLRISHQHNKSQIMFLVLFLKLTFPEKYVSVVTSKLNFRGWSKIIIDSKSIDPETDLKQLLKNMKINLHFLEDCYKQSLAHSDQILVFDLMNVEVVDYKPLILSHKQQLNIPQKTIIYHSHIQDEEIDNFLQENELEFFFAEVTQTFPIQTQFIEKDSEIKDKLVSLIRQDENHPQKQDIIIFYKNEHLSNSTAKRYAQKLTHLFNQKSVNSHVQIVTEKSEIILQNKNHIYIVQNVDQLLEWNYSYEDVLLVIDYGWNTSFRMDHKRTFYIDSLSRNDLQEKTRRLSFVGISKVGKYIYADEQISQIPHYLQSPRQLMTYTLKMIDLQLTKHLQFQNQRVKACVDTLLKNNIIKKDQNNVLTLVDQDILKFLQNGIDPVQTKIIQKCLEKQKQKDTKTLSNLILMTFCVLNTRGNLRQTNQLKSSKGNIKPTGIWRKSGYLDSSLQILTKVEILENGKNTKKSVSKRLPSKMSVDVDADEFGMFGLFEAQVQKKLQFEDMRMDDLIRQYAVDETLLGKIRSKLDDWRDLFQIEQVNIKFDQDTLKQLNQVLVESLPNSVASFLGSRRLGWMYNNQNDRKKAVLPSRDSLIAQLNETPQFILVLRCAEHEGKQQILMCNSIHLDQYMTIFGQLPSKKSQSLADYEIEFHGISSSVFKGLFSNNGMQIKKFQEENKCFIQPNQEMATINLYCSKDQGQRIKGLFQQLIGKIKQKFINCNKIVHYMGTTNISMSNGGQVKQIIKDNYINKCYLNNLDIEVTLEDLQELFQEFFVLKSIEILPVQYGKFSKSAIIEFNSQKDYYRFYSYYNQCKYLNRLLEVKPLPMNKTETIQSQIFVDFKWYVWKSHKKAIVVFKTIEMAQKANKALQYNSQIDGHPVKFSLSKNKINLDDLHQNVDQTFLGKVFPADCEIEDIQILKTPLKQPKNQQSSLNTLIRDVLPIPQNANPQDQYKVFPIQKLKNGLRKCRVKVKKIQNLNIIIGKLNEVKGKFGEGRLYAQSMFTKPILVAYPPFISLYQKILEDTIKQLPQKPNIHHKIQKLGDNRVYLILSSPLNDTLKYVSSQYQKKLLPSPISLTSLQKQIILSDVGIDNLIDLQEKYNCKLIVNSLKKTLEVICRDKDFYAIESQIKLRVEDKFFYRISLNTKSYKNLSKDKQKLEEIKKKYFLSLLQIEEYSKTLIFEGSANHVQNALNYMMHLIESFSKSEEQLINTQVCLICYEQPSRPYRLQNCGHKFCFCCLDQCINSTLGDISMFPIKCPHCMVEVTIDDLESLIEPNSWEKLINMGVTQFVNKNMEIMTFCYSAGCKQINMLKLSNFKCDRCAVEYCCQCKQPWHQGLTCEEAKLGTDTLFKKYMEQNGVRVCPNKNCKMPIVRTDGCFRVTCSRCNKSMCFKCDPDKMIAYDDYNQCYKHLNDVHGGYW